ncbi:MAG: transcription antitermination factor NusB [Dongiaceae bacterium]
MAEKPERKPRRNADATPDPGAPTPKPRARRKPVPAEGTAPDETADGESNPSRPARGVARDLVATVLRRGRSLDEALATDAGFAKLEVRDRAFARELSATVFRRLGQIEVALSACLEKPLPPQAGGAQDLLRLGAAQLLFMRTAPHAAVSETVELATGTIEPFRSLINAVLRRIARDAEAMREAIQPVPTNTPNWLWQRWVNAYGEATAFAIAEAHLADPSLDITIKGDPQAWAGRLEARMLPTGSLRLETAPVETLQGFRDGQWWVQDVAAALPATLFAATLGSVRGRTIIDLCAAPGGKTAQLAAAGANVVAVDRSKERMLRLAQNLKRLGLGAHPIIADATSWRPPKPVDAVLLDAPCSATGTIRRHPDLPWLKRPSDLATLIALQDALLRNALSMLKPGGTLVYAVCSLEPEEGPARIEAILSQGSGIVREPIDPEEIGGLEECVTPAGDLRTLPCHLARLGGMDGFYAARLRRR